MILQRGTTGFQHYKDPQLPLVDLRAFRTVYHAVARDVSADVIHNPRRNPDVECSFADALLQLGDERIVILLNCFHPLVAFASETGSGVPLDSATILICHRLSRTILISPSFRSQHLINHRPWTCCPISRPPKWSNSTTGNRLELVTSSSTTGIETDLALHLPPNMVFTQRPLSLRESLGHER